LEKEEERLEYFEKRQIKHEKHKKEMEAEQLKNKRVRGTFERCLQKHLLGFFYSIIKLKP